MASCIRGGVFYKRHKFWYKHGPKGHRRTVQVNKCMECGKAKVTK